MMEGLFSPENFRDVPVETLRCYKQRNYNLMEQDLTTGCWAIATPKADLIIFMEQPARSLPGVPHGCLEYLDTLVLTSVSMDDHLVTVAFN